MESNLSVGQSIAPSSVKQDLPIHLHTNLTSLRCMAVLGHTRTKVHIETLACTVALSHMEQWANHPLS